MGRKRINLKYLLPMKMKCGETKGLTKILSYVSSLCMQLLHKLQDTLCDRAHCLI